MSADDDVLALPDQPDPRGRRPDWAPAGPPRDQLPAIERMLALRSGLILWQRPDATIGPQS